jgi:hypothetical protein
LTLLLLILLLGCRPGVFVVVLALIVVLVGATVSALSLRLSSFSLVTLLPSMNGSGGILASQSAAAASACPPSSGCIRGGARG